MNYTTRYMPGCCQDLRPYGCYNPPPPPYGCFPQCSPRCGNHQTDCGAGMLYFLAGYIIARNNH